MRVALTCRTLAERELHEAHGLHVMLHQIKYYCAHGLSDAVEYVTFWRVGRLHEHHQRWHLLNRLVNVFWFGKLMAMVATTTDCYDEASALPQLHKMETFLEVIENQRARHLLRHPELDINAVFSDDDMREIYNTWLNDHPRWINTKKLS